MSWRLESSAPGHSLHGAAGTLAWAGDGAFPEAKCFSSPMLSPLYQHVLFQKHTKNHFYFLILAPKQYFKTKNMQSRMQKQRFFFPEQSVREFLQTVAAVLSCFACFVASTVNLFETEHAVWVIFGWVKA